MPKPIRVVVGTSENERSSAWRIWFGPRDIYVGFRGLGGDRKASIHFARTPDQSTLRYVGFTKDFSAKLSGSFVPRPNRTHLEWPGAEISPGYFIEFRMRVPRSELRPLAEDARDVVWITPGPLGTSTEVAIVSGPENSDLHVTFPSHVSNPQLMAEIQLKCGRTVWVISYHFVGPSSDELAQLQRTVVQAFAVHGQLPAARRSVTADSRVNLTFESEDGSAGEWELSGDFLAGT
jgi:hypothetical protein